MKELKIYEYQAKQIEDTFRIVSNLLNATEKKSSLERQVCKSWEMIKNVIDEKPDKQLVNRF